MGSLAEPRAGTADGRGSAPRWVPLALVGAGVDLLLAALLAVLLTIATSSPVRPCAPGLRSHPWRRALQLGRDLAGRRGDWRGIAAWCAGRGGLASTASALWYWPERFGQSAAAA